MRVSLHVRKTKFKAGVLGVLGPNIQLEAGAFIKASHADAGVDCQRLGESLCGLNALAN